MKLKYLLFGGDPEYEYYEEDVYSMGLIPTLIIIIIAAAFFYFACIGVKKGMKTDKTYNNMKTNLEGNYQDLERENEKLRGYISHLEEQLQAYRVIVNEYAEVKKKLEELLVITHELDQPMTQQEQIEEASRRG